MATSSNSNRQQGKSGKRKTLSYIIISLLLCCLLILSVNFLHGSVLHDTPIMALEDFIKDQHLLAAENYPSLPAFDSLTSTKKQKLQLRPKASSSQNQHLLAGLKCEKWGGPSENIAQEMVYWQDIPSDNQHAAPFHSKKRKQYMTFEPDGGGWNNIRMSMETVLAMAHAMGRTLVLPPEARMYLLADMKGGKDGKKKQKAAFSFNDFFHMDSIAFEHEHFDIITMEEFLKLEGVTGYLKDSGKVSYPPNNRTDWNGENKDINKVLYPWLRKVGFQPDWNVNKCLAAFPATSRQEDIEALKNVKKEIDQHGGFPSYEPYVGHPTPVDGPAVDRLKENCAGRKQLCIYDKKMQSEKLVHFSGKPSEPGGRLLVHFYAFLFFQDWRQDLWMKRFIRDHVRYIDELQCAAARVVNAIRKHARQKNPKTNPNGLFDSFHVRRGDFQYKETRIEASVMYERCKDVIAEGSTVYIATDERDKSFFQPLIDHYDVVFLDDFKDQFVDLNTNYYGMLDQLIASRGRAFFGCWFSTFTGFINRMRGYHADKLKLPGHEDGIIESYYYARLDPDDKMRMKKFYPVKQAFHAREFPASWRDIDKGIDSLHEVVIEK